MKNLTLIVWLTQLGLSVAIPPAVLILLAAWLRSRFGWGDWILVIAVILGLVCAVEGLVSSLKAMSRLSADKNEGNIPLSFNDHE